MNLKELQTKLEELMGQGQAQSEVSVQTTPTLDELKALLDKEQLDVDDVIPLLRHFKEHLGAMEDVGISISVIVRAKDQTGYENRGAVWGDPGLCSLAVFTAIKEVLKKV